MQDDWNNEVLIGAHIRFRSDGPWAREGPPVVTRKLRITGSCFAVNSKARGEGGTPALLCFCFLLS